MSEELFKNALQLDGKFTAARVGLAKFLAKRGKTGEAQREAQAVRGEKPLDRQLDLEPAVPGQIPALLRGRQHQVPATVQAILAARIDRLSPEDKRLLQAGAVIGKDMPFNLL